MTQRINTAEELRSAMGLGLLQYAIPSHKWEDTEPDKWSFEEVMADIERGYWRIKPALKKIDLSGLVGSGVLCEFSNAEFDDLGSNQIGLLSGIEAEGFAEIGADGGDFWPNCRPLFNHPHVHTGGKCPIPDGFVIEARKRGGGTINSGSGGREIWVWNHGRDADDRDIIAYTITGIAEGYERNGR